MKRTASYVQGFYDSLTMVGESVEPEDYPGLQEDDLNKEEYAQGRLFGLLEALRRLKERISR